MARIAVTMVTALVLAAAAFATQLCPSCSAANPDDNNFCEACGSPLKAMVTCPQCGEKYPEGTVACGKCGYAFLKPKTVTITAVPKQAEIYVDGVKKGKGAVGIALKPGEVVKVRASARGYDTVIKDLTYSYAAENGYYRITLSKTVRVVTVSKGKGAERAEKLAIGLGVAAVGVANYHLITDFNLGSGVFFRGEVSYAHPRPPNLSKTGEWLIREYTENEYDMIYAYEEVGDDVPKGAVVLGVGYKLSLRPFIRLPITVSASLAGGPNYYDAATTKYEEVVEIRGGLHNHTGRYVVETTGTRFGYRSLALLGFGVRVWRLWPTISLGYAKESRYNGFTGAFDLMYGVF